MRDWFPRITAHSLAIVVSILTYVLTTRSERERRPPAIAIGWVVGMVAFPYLVLPMYLLFGRRKLPRQCTPAAGGRCHPLGSHSRALSGKARSLKGSAT